MLTRVFRTIEREPTRSWRSTGEFVVVWGDFGTLRVSREVGGWIADMTTRRLRPRWLEFVDGVGSLIRLQTSQITGIYDSTPRVRARERLWVAAMAREEGGCET